jgi:hypothetical protein
MAKTVYVTYDHAGKIIAASESKNHAMPLQHKGATTGEFEVPSKFAHMNFREYMPKVQLDVAARRLKEK